MDHIAEIKNRLPIEDLVGQYVQLKKMGRNFKGLCPFHNERTPSFYVSTEKQLAYCFGCRKGGDHFKFIQEIENIDFPEALKMLAEKARVDLPTVTPKQREIINQEKSLKERLFDMHEVAQQFYRDSLLAEVGKDALTYIQNRGFTDEILETFHFGYAPARGSADELFRTLLSAGYTKDECEKSGLILTRNTDASHHFDRFRERLMIPIMNQQGRVCAFGGRALKKDDDPKYLNSPETPIYHKSSILFGLSLARNDIRVQGYVVCVEGYMDMIAAYQAGVKNVVATSGTALTKEHLEILKKITDRLVFSFDADSAGQQATLRALELALPFGFTIGVAVWPGEAKDPDEICKENPALYQEACSKPMPVSEFLIEHFKKLNGTETIEQRVACAQGLMPYVARIESPLFIDEWLKQASKIFGVATSALYKELHTYKTHAKKEPTSNKDKAAPLSAEDKIRQKAEYLLGLLLTYPQTIVIANQMIMPEIFLDPQLQSVYTSLLDQYNQRLGNGFAFEDALKERVSMATMYVEKVLTDSERELSELDATHEVVAVSLQLARAFIAQQKSLFINQLKLATDTEVKDECMRNYEQLLAYELRLSST